MFGIDISNIQRDMKLNENVNFDFAIIKATEGVSFQDKKFLSYAIQLTKLDKAIGCYHFARPDLHSTVNEMIKEADNFVETVEKANLIDSSLLFLDWEKSPIDREDLIQAFIHRVKALTSVAPLIYCNRSHYQMIKKYNIVKQSHIWLAMWPSIEPIEAGTIPYGVVFPTDPKWAIWQYSSNGKWPNYSGRVDLDFTNLTRQEWYNLCRGETNREEDEESLSQDMIWAIQQGLIKGYGDGTYKPSSYLTRNQAATISHRLYEILKEI